MFVIFMLLFWMCGISLNDSPDFWMCDPVAKANFQLDRFDSVRSSDQLSRPSTARWYLSGDAEFGSRTAIQLAQKYPDAFTGVYITFEGTGTNLTMASDGTVPPISKEFQERWASAVFNVSNAIPGRTLTVHGMILTEMVNYTAIRERSAWKALENWASFAKQTGMNGLLLDWEPWQHSWISNKTDERQCASDYAYFLNQAEEIFSKYGLELGIDVSCWGPIGELDILGKSKTTFFTSMDPTYSEDSGNVPKGLEFRENWVRWMASQTGLDRARYGFGSMVAKDQQATCNGMPAYHWNSTTFTTFLDWMKINGFVDIDIWPCDILCGLCGGIADWYVEAVENFLS